MGKYPARVPLVPWSVIEASDLCEANRGEVELYRDTQSGSYAERQIGMHVVGQYDRALSLGIVAIRCARHGERLIPISLAIAETPPFIDTRRGIFAGVQSNPHRCQADGDSGDDA